MTEPSLIIDPRDGKVYDFGTDLHDFKKVPPALFKLFWWLASTRHESVNWNDDAAVKRLVDQLSVPVGRPPRGRIANDLFDAFSLCGGLSRDFPHKVRPVEVGHYLAQLKHL